MWYRLISMKALKTLVIWLLLVMLPLQGSAITIAMTCKAAHQGVTQAPVDLKIMQHDMHTMHAMQDNAPHHAHDHAGHASEDGASQDYKPADRTCSMYCGTALCIPAAVFSPPAVANAASRISYIPFHVPFVVPDGPEHRPRLLFA